MQYPADTLYLTEMAEEPHRRAVQRVGCHRTTDISIAQFYDIWPRSTSTP